MDEEQRNDQLLASAVKFLIDGGEEKAAAVLLSCTLAYEEDRWVDEEDIPDVEQALEQGKEVAWNITRIITLRAPRATYDILGPINNRNYYKAEFRAEFGWDFQENFGISDHIINAFYALLGGRIKFLKLTDFDSFQATRSRASSARIDSSWCFSLREAMRSSQTSRRSWS